MNSLLLSKPVYIELDHCGYCHGRKRCLYPADDDNAAPSIMIGFGVQQMSCVNYDKLMNMGFRRSGNFVYKPDLLRSCCRLYTIRTSMKHLKLTKLHRQTVNRFVRAITASATPTKSRNAPFDIAVLHEAEQLADRKIFHTRLEPSLFTTEKFELYKKYQVRVHNDKPGEVTPSSFKRFLCETPFSEKEVSGDQRTWDFLNQWQHMGTQGWPAAIPRRIGPTHECYYFRGELVAISILDFLPSGVSSIYLIWDPDHPQLSLGTLLGLREIYMCHRLELGYYYLGYYIDDCVKMKYKRQFGGEVLDVSTMTFIPFDKVAPFIAGDKLFFAAPSDNKVMVQPEISLNSQGYPYSFEQSSIFLEPLANFAERVYGCHSVVFAEAEAALATLHAKYGVALTTDEHSIPLVVPGLLPLSQVLSMFESGDVGSRDRFGMINVETYYRKGEIYKTLASMAPEEKRIVVDCIRLLGTQLTSAAFVMH